MQAVEFDDLLLRITWEIRFDILVEPLVVLLLALPDLRDGEPAAISLVGEVEHEARLGLDLPDKPR